jgi:hypothetical protein
MGGSKWVKMALGTKFVSGFFNPVDYRRVVAIANVLSLEEYRMSTVFKKGDGVITIMDVKTGKGPILSGSTGIVVGIFGDPEDPWIKVLMNFTPGICLEDEEISFYHKSLQLVSDQRTKPDNKGVVQQLTPDQFEANFKKKRDEMLKKALGF